MIHSGRERGYPKTIIGYFESLNLLKTLREVPESEHISSFNTFLYEFKSATRQYSRKQENWFASKSEFRWIRRPFPFERIDPEISSLFSLVLKAIQVPREEYEAIDGWLAEEDAIARDLVTDQVRKKMKCYKGPPTRFSGKFLEDFLKRIQKLLK